MAIFQKFDVFAEDVGRGVHHIGTDVLRLFFTSQTPDAATMTVKADFQEINPAGNYPTGGLNIGATLSRTGAVSKIHANDLLVETTGRDGDQLGPFRAAVVYNDSSPNDSLIGFWDYGQQINASRLTLNFDTDAVTTFGA